MSGSTTSRVRSAIDEQGREVWSFIEGDVPIPPFPEWSMSEAALVSVARLQRRLHDAAAGFDASTHAWNDELADPRGGPVVGHNDICPENVVFREGEAIAFLDWDFAAPGRTLWDVAAVMSMWGPVHDPSDPVPGMEGLDPFARARSDRRRLRPDRRATRRGSRDLRGSPLAVAGGEASGRRRRRVHRDAGPSGRRRSCGTSPPVARGEHRVPPRRDAMTRSSRTT